MQVIVDVQTQKPNMKIQCSLQISSNFSKMPSNIGRVNRRVTNKSVEVEFLREVLKHMRSDVNRCN
jgi:hypothetical protein